MLPDEDAVEFQALEAVLVDELAPEGALQVVLARRVAVAAWRLARADRMEVELFEERRWEDAGVGMALIRDGNGTHSFETLLRYRGAAMAEFWRALKTLKALQAEQANVLEQAAGADLALELPATQLAAPAPVRAQSSPSGRRLAHADRRGPNEPERLMAYLLPRAAADLEDRAGRWQILAEHGENGAGVPPGGRRILADIRIRPANPLLHARLARA